MTYTSFYINKLLQHLIEFYSVLWYNEQVLFNNYEMSEVI